MALIAEEVLSQWASSWALEQVSLLPKQPLLRFTPMALIAAVGLVSQRASSWVSGRVSLLPRRPPHSILMALLGLVSLRASFWASERVLVLPRQPLLRSAPMAP